MLTSLTPALRRRRTWYSSAKGIAREAAEGVDYNDVERRAVCGRHLQKALQFRPAVIGAACAGFDKLDNDVRSARGAELQRRGMDEARNLGAQMAMMPAPLADRVGNEAGLPTREVLSTYLSVSVAADIACQRQRSDRADGALFRHLRHQQPEFRPPRLSRRSR